MRTAHDRRPVGDRRASPSSLAARRRERRRLDAGAAAGARLTLRHLVTPASRIEVQGRLIRFALHGLIRFDTLDDLFAFIDGEAGRWRFESAAARQAFADGLLRRGVESRVVSMETELPLELVLTHTRAELERAVAGVDDGAMRRWCSRAGTGN